MSGGQTVLMDMINSLINRIQISILVPSPGKLSVFLKSRFSDNVEIIEMYSNNSYCKLIDFLKTFFKVLFFKNYNIVYVNGLRYLPIAIFASLYWKSILYIHIHIKLPKYFTYIYVISSFLPIKVRYIFNSNFNFLDFKNLIYLNKLKLKNNTAVLENCLQFKYGNLNFLNRFSKSNHFGVLVAGTITPNKGQDLVCSIAKLFPHVKFHFVGNINEKDQSYAEKILRISPNIFYHGFVDNLYDFINSTDINISIVPSRWDESFGLIAIESMAFSCITLTSSKGALKDISLKTGSILFEDRDSLIRELERLFQLPALNLASMAKEQHANCICTYSPTIFQKEFLHLLMHENDESSN